MKRICYESKRNKANLQNYYTLSTQVASISLYPLLSTNPPIGDVFCDQNNDSSDELSALLIDALSLRIDDIEKKISNVEQAVLNIGEYIESNISDKKINEIEGKLHIITNELSYGELVDASTFKNTIKCLQREINKMNITILSDEVSTMKMNHQLHVLSAKYIEFNRKINNHIFDFNKRQNHTILVDQVIDKDALPFIEQSKLKQPDRVIKLCEKMAENQFASSQLADGRFGEHFNQFTYSKFVRVCINEARISNLNNFIDEFESFLSKIIGKKAINRSVVEKYSVVNSFVDQVVVVVSFTVPMSYSYLKSFWFLVNWHFVQCTNHSCVCTTSQLPCIKKLQPTKYERIEKEGTTSTSSVFGTCTASQTECSTECCVESPNMSINENKTDQLLNENLSNNYMADNATNVNINNPVNKM